MEDILRRRSRKIIFVQYPLIKMKMKNLSILLTLGVALVLSGCSKLGNSSKGIAGRRTITWRSSSQQV
jgi:hypothetical protein